MDVLICASECYPFAKVGGIADVIGSLPLELYKENVNIRVVIPCYKHILENKTFLKTIVKRTKFSLDFNSKTEEITLYQSYLPNSSVVIYFLYNETYLSNGGIYSLIPNSYLGDVDRFAFFSRAVSEVFCLKNIFIPDIIHCNDWHTAMIPQFIEEYKRNIKKAFPKTILTIHNLGYHGKSELRSVSNAGLNLKDDKTLNWDSKDDIIDFLLQGIVGCDYITTVSKQYAKEIQSSKYGEGLDKILKARTSRVIGILNGIDYETVNPAKDSFIENYNENSYAKGKAINKKLIEKSLKLEPNRPLIGIISRLAYQKGLDIVSNSYNEIIKLGYNVILLGTGDKDLEEKFNKISKSKGAKANFSATTSFSSKLASQIYAASDVFLIPSRYEPCGLTQMIAMRYGSVPCARKTGGLKDTIKNGKTGFLYDQDNKGAMLKSLKTIMKIYKNSDEWTSIIKRCMCEDFSWGKSATEYKNLYTKCLNN